MQTKEYFIGHHFGIRCIDDLVCFVDIGTLLFEITLLSSPAWALIYGYSSVDLFPVSLQVPEYDGKRKIRLQSWRYE